MRRFGTVYQRAGRDGFYVRFRRDGREVRRFGGSTQKQAEKRLLRAHAMFDDGASVDAVLSQVFGDFDGERLTFRESVAHYLAYAETRKKASTIKADAQRLGLVMRAGWASGYLAKIRPEQISRWAQKRVQDGTSGPTVNRDLSLISALYQWAKLMDYTSENPARRVPRFSEKGRKREVYLTAEEANALLAQCADDLRAVVLCALHTGMRRGELLSLQWRSVDFECGVVRVEAAKEKAGRGREVPMTEQLRAELLALHEQRKVFRMDGADSVFARRGNKSWSESSLRSLFVKALAACEAIPDEKRNQVTFHTLRHTAASLLVQAGVPLMDVGKFLGHSSPVVTWRYAHLAPESGRVAAEVLSKALQVL